MEARYYSRDTLVMIFLTGVEAENFQANKKESCQQF